jgi:hypothetical protein
MAGVAGPAASCRRPLAGVAFLPACLPLLFSEVQLASAWGCSTEEEVVAGRSSTIFRRPVTSSMVSLSVSSSVTIDRAICAYLSGSEQLLDGVLFRYLLAMNGERAHHLGEA